MNRSNEKEWMDLGPGFYSEKEYETCLKQLNSIGRYLGGDKATLWGFKQLQSVPESIVDVGCGGGLFTMRMAKWFPKADVIGVDISENAIAFANRNLTKELSNVNFRMQKSATLDFMPRSIDVVTATLVCHHLNDAELMQFLKDAYKVAKKAIIINDLHRHCLATLSYALVAPLLSKMVVHDGFISIRRGFTRQEWITLLNAAEIPSQQFSITWHWAFRWIILITKEG